MIADRNFWRSASLFMRRRGVVAKAEKAVALSWAMLLSATSLAFADTYYSLTWKLTEESNALCSSIQFAPGARVANNHVRFLLPGRCEAQIRPDGTFECFGSTIGPTAWTLQLSGKIIGSTIDGVWQAQFNYNHHPFGEVSGSCSATVHGEQQDPANAPLR